MFYGYHRGEYNGSAWSWSAASWNSGDYRLSFDVVHHAGATNADNSFSLYIDGQLRFDRDAGVAPVTDFELGHRRVLP